MKILVNWDYERRDLMHPFEKLKSVIDWVFIYKNIPSEKPGEQLYGNNILYWDQFSSPYALLAHVKPDKILFHDIESFPQVALNMAAKNKGIETLVLEHGLRAAYEVDIAYEKARSPQRETAPSPAVAAPNHRSAFLFYLRAFRIKNIPSFFPFIRFPFIRRKHGLTIGLHKAPFLFRQAEKYINFTMHNASYILKRDQVSTDKITPIGNPNFDQLFDLFRGSANSPEANYYLLIDAPYCEQAIFNLPKEQKISFYNKLNEFCLTKGASLKIKLHPQSYNANYLPLHTNIEYLRETNIAEQIVNAKGCILVNLSTLAPLALYYSKCIYMNSGLNPYDRELISHQYVPEYDFFDFTSTGIEFKPLNEEARNQIIDMYLYSIDGKATERLKQILLR